MAALERRADVRFEIFSAIPEFLIRQSLARPVGSHHLVCDVGLVNTSALEIDYKASLQRLSEFYPFDSNQIHELANKVRGLGCDLVVCDIAPMGITVAAKAGIPSVFTENFTWHWIYEDYLDQEPGFKAFADQIRSICESVDYHIQTAPAGVPNAQAWQTEPVSRVNRMSRQELRAQLGVPYHKKLVVLTMGGFSQDFEGIDALEAFDEAVFLIPGLDRGGPNGPVFGLPHFSDFYHPDLINAADLVIGKIGYSTFAEVCNNGVPFGYVARENFRESGAIEAYIRAHMPAMAFSEQDFVTGTWINRMDELLQLKARPKPLVNGADQVAELILSI